MQRSYRLEPVGVRTGRPATRSRYNPRYRDFELDRFSVHSLHHGSTFLCRLVIIAASQDEIQELRAHQAQPCDAATRAGNSWVEYGHINPFLFGGYSPFKPDGGPDHQALVRFNEFVEG